MISIREACAQLRKIGELGAAVDGVDVLSYADAEGGRREFAEFLGGVPQSRPVVVVRYSGWQIVGALRQHAIEIYLMAPSLMEVLRMAEAISIGVDPDTGLRLDQAELWDGADPPTLRLEMDVLTAAGEIARFVATVDDRD